MNMSIEKMLSHVYEIEGLMLVTRRLGEENTPQVITDKIQRKVRELAQMCDVTLAAPEQPAVPAPQPAPEQPLLPLHPQQPKRHRTRQPKRAFPRRTMTLTRHGSTIMARSSRKFLSSTTRSPNRW